MGYEGVFPVTWAFSPSSFFNRDNLDKILAQGAES